MTAMIIPAGRQAGALTSPPSPARRPAAATDAQRRAPGLFGSTNDCVDSIATADAPACTTVYRFRRGCLNVGRTLTHCIRSAQLTRTHTSTIDTNCRRFSCRVRQTRAVGKGSQAVDDMTSVSASWPFSELACQRVTQQPAIIVVYDV